MVQREIKVAKKLHDEACIVQYVMTIVQFTGNLLLSCTIKVNIVNEQTIHV